MISCSSSPSVFSCRILRWSFLFLFLIKICVSLQCERHSTSSSAINIQMSPGSMPLANLDLFCSSFNGVMTEWRETTRLLITPEYPESSRSYKCLCYLQLDFWLTIFPVMQASWKWCLPLSPPEWTITLYVGLTLKDLESCSWHSMRKLANWARFRKGEHICSYYTMCAPCSEMDASSILFPFQGLYII